MPMYDPSQNGFASPAVQAMIQQMQQLGLMPGMSQQFPSLGGAQAPAGSGQPTMGTANIPGMAPMGGQITQTQSQTPWGMQMMGQQGTLGQALMQHLAQSGAAGSTGGSATDEEGNPIGGGGGLGGILSGLMGGGGGGGGAAAGAIALMFL